MTTEEQLLLNLSTRVHNLLRQCQIPGNLSGEAAEIINNCALIHKNLTEPEQKQEVIEEAEIADESEKSAE